MCQAFRMKIDEKTSPSSAALEIQETGMQTMMALCSNACAGSQHTHQWYKAGYYIPIRMCRPTRFEQKRLHQVGMDCEYNTVKPT